MTPSSGDVVQSVQGQLAHGMWGNHYLLIICQKVNMTSSKIHFKTHICTQGTNVEPWPNSMWWCIKMSALVICILWFLQEMIMCDNTCPYCRAHKYDWLLSFVCTLLLLGGVGGVFIQYVWGISWIRCKNVSNWKPHLNNCTMVA